MPSPGQVAQPRPQHSDISTVPAPWQAGHNACRESVSRCSCFDSIMRRAWQAIDGIDAYQCARVAARCGNTAMSAVMDTSSAAVAL
jgi:hypothetical protein